MTLQKTISDLSAIEQTNLTTDMNMESLKHFKIIHTINLTVTIAFTVIYFTLYGLMLMPIVGFTQIVLSIILFSKKELMTAQNRILFYRYLQLTGGIIVTTTSSFLIAELFKKNMSNDVNTFLNVAPFIILLLGGGALSYFHLWITKQLKEQEVQYV